MQDSRTNKIWRGLVGYVNATDLESNGDTLKSLADTLLDCMHWMARNPYGNDTDDVPAMLAVQISPDVLWGTVEGRKGPVWLYLESEEELAHKFRRQAIEYKPQIHRLLNWLSDPKNNMEDRPFSFSFLLNHAKHMEFQSGEPAYAPEEEAPRYWKPVHHWAPSGKLIDETFELKDDFPHRTRAYKDIADPICDFIQTQHELGRGIPIQVCKRPGCGSLVIQFKKREYCRTAICNRERQKRDDNVKLKKNRDNVFLCRLRKMPPPIRRKKARESVDRLRQIESNWREKNQSLAKHALKLLAEAQ